jgi:hypothetical protein
MSNDMQPVTNKSTRRGEAQLRLHTGSPGGYLTASAVRKWFDDVDTITLAVALAGMCPVCDNHRKIERIKRLVKSVGWTDE